MLETGSYPSVGGRAAHSADITAGVVMTLALHLAIVGSIVWATMRSNESMKDQIEPKMLQFEKVELLALGEEKPPEALPRIANPEPITKKPDEVILEQPDEPVVELKKVEPIDAKEDEKDRKQKMLEALSALNNPNRPTNDVVPAGSEQGVIGGTISDAALANLLGTYATRLVGELSRVWDMPTTIAPSEVPSLSNQVEVYVRLSASGNVVSYQFRQKSTNEQFNESIERVLKKFMVAFGGRTLPLPEDPAVREAVIREGLNLMEWEYTGR